MNSIFTRSKVASVLGCAVGIALLTACSATSPTTPGTAFAVSAASVASQPAAISSADPGSADPSQADPSVADPSVADPSVADPTTQPDPGTETGDDSGSTASPADSGPAQGPESTAAPADGTQGRACALVSVAAMAKILGGPVTTLSTGDLACVFHTGGDSPVSVEIAELPSSVLAGQLGQGSFAPLNGVGDKAYWNADETLLVVVKGASELAINASVGDDANTAKQAAIAVAKAALPGL